MSIAVSDPIIRTRGLAFSYHPQSQQPIDALRGIDLDVYPGEYLVIIGHNGSGKSTLAKQLNALLRPTGGEVRVKGLDTRDKANILAVRRAVGMVFQVPDNQIVATVVEEDVAFGPENLGLPGDELHERVDWALDLVGLTRYRHSQPHRLSAGQKQRVAIAGVMAMRPEVLVLDEATAWLDPEGRRDVLAAVRKLAGEGLTVVAITHSMEEAAQGDRVIVLEEGRIALEGAPRQVFARIDELRALQLDVPQVTEMAYSLSRRLPTFPPDLLTVGELADAVERVAEVPGRWDGAMEPVGGPQRPAGAGEPEGEPLIQVQDLHHTYLRGTPLEAPALEFVAHADDGQEVVPGELVAEVRGPGRGLLAAERTALNFLQRLSGIATGTRRFVDAVACTGATVLDTRKTPPGYRVLDKYAVRMGGGQNHRQALYDMVLVKDNHVDAAGGIVPAVARARDTHPELPIEVEVRTLDELRQSLGIDPPLDRILLDNMTLEQMRQAVALAAGRVPLEASGGVTLERAAEIAATGVDYLSVGALTHSVEALDLSMKIAKPGRVGRPEAARGAAVASRVAAAKAALGERLVVLGHHYQRDAVLAFADFRGDSLKLARDAGRIDAEFIVFCGVHFMAETAAILAGPGQHVLIPDTTAGCYLADTATVEAVEAAWPRLPADEFTPITYVNSSAALKAFCGQQGGIVCTSGNAERAIAWALSQRPRVFFFPDQHLGRNTAKRMGLPLEKMLLWDAHHPPDANAIRRAKVVLWPGACNVHQRFRPEQVRAVRRRLPGVRVVVHPECPMEVVDLADDAGSTAHIIARVEAAPPGTRWAIGTEARLVQRLQAQHPEQAIVPLAEVPPFCQTMSQITLDNLAEVLEGLLGGELVNAVTVDAEVARWARVALERMLAI